MQPEKSITILLLKHTHTIFYHNFVIQSVFVMSHCSSHLSFTRFKYFFFVPFSVNLYIFYYCSMDQNGVRQSKQWIEKKCYIKCIENPFAETYYRSGKSVVKRQVFWVFFSSLSSFAYCNILFKKANKKLDAIVRWLLQCKLFFQLCQVKTKTKKKWFWGRRNVVPNGYFFNTNSTSNRSI